MGGTAEPKPFVPVFGKEGLFVGFFSQHPNILGETTMYQSLMTVRETQIAIKEVKTFFEDQLAKRLELFRVSAPLFVTKNQD